MSQVQNFTSVSDLGGLLAIANNNTNGWAWTGMLFLVYFVMLISLSASGWTTAILVSSFVGLLIATLLAYMGLVSMTIALIFLGIILLMFIVIIFTKQEN